ncbi:hypothetical protein ACHAWX_005226 [Stephanocyclus meneghinianus]
MIRPTTLLLTLVLYLPTTTAGAKKERFLGISLSESSPTNLSLSSLLNLSSYVPPGLRTFDPSSPNDSCFSPLWEADANGDGNVSNQEYVTFVESLSEGVWGQMEFRELPFVLKVNFVYLSCLCEENGMNNCCKVRGDGVISTAGAGPNDIPTEAQLQYLDTVCSTTQASIDYAMKEMSPRPTASPTGRPTAESSDVPTQPPTPLPLDNSTPSPMEASASVPTDSPSAGESTNAPTYLEMTESPAASTSPSPNLSVSPTSINIIPPSPAEPTSPPSFSYQPSNPPTPEGDLGLIDGTEEPDKNTKTEILSPGGIAGIVIASMVVVIAGLILTRKRRQDEEDPSLEVFDDKKKGDEDLEMGITSDLSGDGPSPRSAVDSAVGEAGSVAIITPSPSEAEDVTMTTEAPLDAAFEGSAPVSPSAVPPYSPERFRDIEVESISNDDSSSSAGQSGWSSSQGLSSLNTASFDAGTDDGLLPPPVSGASALAAIGAASAITWGAISAKHDDKRPVPKIYSNNDDDSISSVDEEGQKGQLSTVTRKDLDAAIEAGDWAAVGATAALLANTSEHGSDEPLQASHRLSRVSDLDDCRTTELDKLVEAGDWQGVVLAAAQFEGQSESDFGSKDGSDDQLLDDASEPSLLARGRSTKLESIRAEVELLVRRVVPDELDNIDEMMIQFSGRENELIETLKTMQERSIAQRARAAVQQSAKLEARTRAQGQNVLRGNGSTSTSSGSQSFLELAIEKGDWQAVGEAAAMMGGSSAVIEDDTQYGSNSSSISSSLSDSRSRSASRDSTLSRDKSERIRHLDNLIAAGDWAGIVAAAGQYQAMDGEVGQSPPIDASLATEEERDALAQAEMWRAIAKQSKQDISSASQGASEAADWAISRSLRKHSAPASAVDQPDTTTKAAKLDTYQDDLSV